MSTFPRDLLWILRELQFLGTSDKIGGFPDAVARYLLLELGLSVEEADEVNRHFLKAVSNNELGRLIDAMQRIKNIAEQEGFSYLKKFVVSSMATILQVQQSELTEQ